MSAHLPPGSTPAAAVRATLAAIVCRELSVSPEGLDADTDLAGDLLLDSLAKVELAMVVEDALSVGLTDTEVGTIRTFGDLCDAVAAQLASG